MKDAKSKIPELMQIGISATLSAVFYAPLFGLASVNEERLDSEEKAYRYPFNKAYFKHHCRTFCGRNSVFA